MDVLTQCPGVLLRLTPPPHRPGAQIAAALALAPAILLEKLQIRFGHKQALPKHVPNCFRFQDLVPPLPEGQPSFCGAPVC